MQAHAPSVLTVEDDPIVRADLRLALEDAGFDVVAHAGDEIEALELARELEPDVIVVDLALRRRDGAVTPQLREPSVPIVELPRPFHPSQVVEAVTGALVGHRERKIRETRNTSLRSIESLVENLSFATPAPGELEQASWDRGHVWRRVDSE